MKKKLFLLCPIIYIGFVMAVPHAWINEIHYDNAGTDINEFVEVVVESPESWYLGDLALYMYNGYDGNPYCLDTIDEFEIGERIGPFQFYVWYQRGIQNDMEGMILVFKDSLCDIMAYEGSFIGSNEPALGKEFPDIEVYETGYGSDSNSIYLTGLPGNEWTYGPATPGRLNSDQLISESSTPVQLSTFYAKVLENKLLLRWQSESESESSYYRLYRNRFLVASIESKGTTTIPNDYSFIDEEVLSGISYEYIISTIDHAGYESFLDTLLSPKIKLSDQLKPFTLSLPRPNPFNSVCVIKMHVNEALEIKMDLIDLSGKKVMNILQQNMPKGDHDIIIDLDKYPSGKYFIQCSSTYLNETLEIVMLK